MFFYFEFQQLSITTNKQANNFDAFIKLTWLNQISISNGYEIL